MQKLSELKTGEKGYIVKVSGYGGFRKRIVEMGFIKGQEVEAVQEAPLQDPVKYRIMGYDVSLRRSVAAQIDIIKADEAQNELLQNENSNYLGTFSEDDFRQVALKKRREINVALVGNPNSGKSTLFNASTGQHAKVGNYSGVTVDAKFGSFFYKDYHFNFADLPGTYSISAFSPEERYVREHIVKEKPDVVLNVVDSGNLERNLYLTTQLIDMNIRSVIALNFYDELEKRGDVLDCVNLGKLLGIPVRPISAVKGIGLDILFDTIIKIYEGSEIIDKAGVLIESIVRHVHINYGKTIEKSIAKLKEEVIKNESAYDDFTPRYLAIQLLQRDKDIEEIVARFENYSKLNQIRDLCDKKIGEELKTSAANAIMDAKYGFIAGALKETFAPAEVSSAFTPTSKIDRIVTDRFLAYPIFAIIIFLMFEATFKLGEYPMKWIEWLVAKFGGIVSAFLPDGIFKDLVTEGIIGGVGSVLVFLPNILILYFCMTLLESSGYLARAAFIMDKIMHKIGLHGKSFIPLMMGFGCNVPAIMATRTIENRNSRMTTILITSFIPCTARLPVFIILISAFIHKYQGLTLFLVYFAGIFLVAIMAKIFRKFVFNKDETPFVMELPAYRLPAIKYVLRDTWEKGYQYLKKIGSTILVGSVVIWALSYFPTSHSNNTAKQIENSYLARIGKGIEPVMKPLGYDWKISVSLLTGAAAKEMIISTMGVLYNANEDNSNTSLPQKLQEATYPNGTPVYSFAAVISLILFVLTYFPCIATIATIKQETNSWGWALFTAIYTLLLAWIISFTAYTVINHGIIQEVTVGLILLICLLFISRRLLNLRSVQNNKRTGCAGCDQSCPFH